MKKLPSINEINLLMEECTKSDLNSDLVFDLLNEFEFTPTVLQICVDALCKEGSELSRYHQISMHLLKYELMILNKKAIDLR